MTRGTTQAIDAFLSAHLRTPGEMVVAAETVTGPSGPDPGALGSAAASLARMAGDAGAADLAAVQDLSLALVDAARGLAAGALDPMGPVAGALGQAASTLEEALIALEAGDRPDDRALRDQASRLCRFLGQPETASVLAPAPASKEPADPLSQGEVTRWGPWSSPYADMEDDYIEEVRSCIDNLQNGLIRLSDKTADASLINDLFRSSHSIKGQSGQMAVGPLEKVAHKLEDVLDRIRQGKLTIDAGQTEALLRVIDALGSMLEQLKKTRSIEHPIGQEISLLERIMRGEAALAAPAAPVAPAAPAAPAPPAALPPSPAGAPAQAAPSPAVSTLAATAGASRPGSDARAQYLRVDFAKVDHVMNLVGDLFVNKIKLHHGLNEIDELMLEVHRLGNILARRGDGSRSDLTLDPEEAQRLLEGMRRLSQEVESIADRLHAATSETDMISADLRDQVMVMRMVPLDSILGRLGRVLFDALQKENRGKGPDHKKARLVVQGADSEIDKVISNMLEVPLVHIVRNAVAHGIEPSAERVAAGKPAEGTVDIRAGQQGTRFVIEVKDDGRGILPEQVKKAALAKGIVEADELASMSEREILSLIFRPGFTTAEQADDLKGRGVGLDEVMQKVSAIKGLIEVDSSAGKGTRVTLSLPLTLAINTVVLGEVAGETFALPMAAVERVVRVGETEIEKMGETEVFTLQGQTSPLVRVDELLGMGRPASQRPDESYVTILHVGERRFGLAVDRMTGKQDVVVKSLGTLLGEVPMVAGATLLGERCILILDPQDIASRLGRASAAARGRAEAPSKAPGLGRMLLVEDEASTRKTLRRIFEETGLEVYEAEDGQQALEMARKERFAVVSTDVVMPRMDGYELTRRLRELPGFGDVPIIMISSRGDEPDRRAGFDAGVDHYVVKPFERSKLLALVEEVLR